MTNRQALRRAINESIQRGQRIREKLAAKNDFVIDANTYKQNKQLEQRNYEIEIGDGKRANEFYPQLKAMTLDNDANLSVRLLDVDEEFTTAVNDDKLELEYSDKKVVFYDVEGYSDRFEFGVILKSKPADNVVRYSIRHKNVSFHKQPTAAQMMERHPELKDVYIPDHIVGSYAVFHENEHYIGRGRAGYKTGKVMQIYAPWAEDSKGERVWCELDIYPGDNEMTITIPRSFYENASYPVFVDPTFGYTTDTESESTLGSDQLVDNTVARHYTAESGKEIQSYHAKIRKTAGTCSFGIAAYDMGVTNDPDGATIVGTEQTMNCVATGSLTWEEITGLSIALTENNKYAISCGNKNESGGVVKIGLDGLGGSQMKRGDNTGALESPFDADLSDPSYMVTIYATYGNQPGPPEFSGTIPNYQDTRVTPVSIQTASYFTNPETFTADNLPGGCSINSTTGEITWASPVVGTYSSITVTCTNGQGNDTSNAFSITIDAQPPIHTSAITNKSGNVGSAITTLQASNHFQHATSYAATNLPAGLTIDTGTGDIDGTPTTENVYVAVKVTATNVDGSTDSNEFTWTIGAALPIPTITEVNESKGIQRTQSIEITGTNFEAAQGGGTVTYNGDSMTVTAWSDTSITFTAPSDGYVFGNSYDLEVTNDSGYSVISSREFTPHDGFAWVTLSVNYDQFPSNSVFYQEAGITNLSVGDQVLYETAVSPQGAVSLDSQGVPLVTGAGAAGDYTFDYMFNHLTDLTVSGNGVAVVTLQAGDTDVTAPSWVSTPAISNVLETTATCAGSINENGDIFIVVVPATEQTPTSAQVIAGQNAAGGSPSFAGSVLANTAFNFSITGLTQLTQYKACVVARDDEGTPNVQASATVVNFTTAETPDLDAPTFITGPTVSQVQITSCVLNAQISETGTIYWAIIPAGAQTPTSAEIIDGQWTNPDDSPVTPIASGSGSAITGFLVTGLAGGTVYKVCWTAVDTANNIIQVPTVINFTTSSAGTSRSLTGVLKDYDTGDTYNSIDFKYQIQTSWGEVSDTGDVTTDGAGNFTLGSLNAAAGAVRAMFEDEATGLKVALAPATVVEA